MGNVITKRLAVLLGLPVVLAGVWSSVASAHVVVKPAQAETAAFQSFSVGVPNEKEDNPTVKVRLVVPGGLKYVTPNVKPGWQIETVKSGDGEAAVVKEIIWSGGQVPSGQRDDFVFSAQVPAAKTTLTWKAYQTYADGTEVAWDQDPAKSGSGHSESATPASQTKVVDSLGGSGSGDGHGSASDTANKNSASSNAGLGIAVVALVLSLIALTSRQSTAAKKPKTSKK